LELLKAYGNDSTVEIHRLRGQLEDERARAVAELEAAHSRALATEDRIAALEATGLMQQVVTSELEM
jgi:regulator of protease activity HflC (stomatin/prohibitin superfamily)